mmetsp:Transcript_19073/g.31077  ORF Transcript_19073/g.31077 Transcript_19073/m.31077 type:complete len:153 (+) Transcript_19073:86-544(+)
MRDPSLCRSKDLGPMMRSKQPANSHQQRCRKSSLTDAGRSYSFPPRKMAQSRLRRWDGGTQQASPQLGEGTNFSPNGNASHSEAVCGNKKIRQWGRPNKKMESPAKKSQVPRIPNYGLQESDGGDQSQKLFLPPLLATSEDGGGGFNCVCGR